MPVLHIQTYISNVIFKSYISRLTYPMLYPILHARLTYPMLYLNTYESFLNSFIMLLVWVVEHSLVHWYLQCVSLHRVSKCMSYYEVNGGLLIFLTTYFLIQHTVLVITIMVLWQLMPLSTSKYTNYKKILKREPRTWAKDVFSQLLFYMLLD